MADGIAVEGIRLVFENLPKALPTAGPTARANMMSAAYGRDGRNRLIHSLSHPIGASTTHIMA
jgi:alcohol dehydrogenase class IV